MFEPGTILRLREPQGTDEKPYAYDRVEVVGQSPVQYATAGDSPWAGQDAIGWVLKPAGEAFGPTVDKPLGQINALYEIESWPTDPATGEPLKPENATRGPSPEQVFAKAAADAEVKRREKAGIDVQHDRKSPEQALREAEAKARAAEAPRRRRRQTEETPDDE